MFSTISRKIKDGKFQEPTVQEFVIVQSPKKPRTVVAKDTITDELRKQFEEDFADFDFEDLPEQEQELQEQELERIERMEESVSYQEYLKDVDRVLQDDVTDDDCPIWVRNSISYLLLPFVLSRIPKQK